MKRGARALLILGPLVVVLAMSKYHAARIAEPAYDFVSSFRFPWALAYVGLLWTAAYAVGLPSQRASRRAASLAAVGAVLVATIGLSLAQLVVGSPLLPRFVVLGSMGVLVPWFVLTARMAGDLDSRARDATRVVVVGDLADVGSLWVDLESAPELPATIGAVLTPGEAAVGRHSAPLVEAVAASSASVVVLDIGAQQEPSIVRQAALLHERGVRIRSLSGFYEEWLGKLPISALERVSLMFDIAEVHGGRYVPLKRLLDVAVAAVAAVALAVAVPFVVVGNLVANRGPLWFRQERVGKGGRTFTILKFRTMVPAGVAAGVGEWTAAGDPRVTRFGRFLRRTHLDELPQAWNILRGDLSIVGPRPEQPHYVEELADKLPFYPLRHLVRPGLTGWAQVKYGYAGDHQDALEKLQYEFFYLRHQGLPLDLRVMVRTFRSVLGGSGAGR
jgi:lipopolysaccharide/colanic/teichoic acid biosynthesis glycosyltransferase